jgi:hypothetical protein
MHAARPRLEFDPALQPHAAKLPAR